MDRTELAALLKLARDRLRPGDVGLPAGPRRQVPGLRREEVAQLAGVTFPLSTPHFDRMLPAPSLLPRCP
ncbi:hypothetical protein ACW9HQ_18455 [Nocardia gipuzkoensis]